MAGFWEVKGANQMANRLQRIMMMDQMFQNRNMPQSGVQSVFNPTTGTFVNVPFQTDPNFKGRRTVMTPSGPQVLPGFQGQENPYRQLGRTARNLLGNLFDRGLLRQEKRKRQRGMEQADQMLDTMDPSVLQRPEFDPVPDNQARIDELQERINRPIVTSQNLPTFDVSQVKVKSDADANRKTTLFADGSAQIIDTKGNARLLTKDGSQIDQNDPRYEQTLRDSIASGFVFETKMAEAKETGKRRVEQIDSAESKVNAAERSISVLDRALAALDAGGKTGPFIDLLPTIRESSLLLESIQRELGLNVVSDTTFGALSEGELNLALRTGLDTRLPPDALRQQIL
ncbi:MAG: hypothetical protein CL997_05720, partial [Euryarchaeota archaeon]|nr:hypothetical protein [Euryarchaeota archaeon]